MSKKRLTSERAAEMISEIASLDDLDRTKIVIAILASALHDAMDAEWDEMLAMIGDTAKRTAVHATQIESEWSGTQSPHH